MAKLIKKSFSDNEIEKNLTVSGDGLSAVENSFTGNSVGGDLTAIFGNNNTIREVINNNGLDERAVGQKLNDVCSELKSFIEQNGVSVSNNIGEYIRSVVLDSALTLMLRIDDNAQQTEKTIERAVKANFEGLTITLLPQLKNSFQILSAQARKDKEQISSAFEKWQREWSFYAARANDACTEIKFICGVLTSAKASALRNLEYGRKLLSDGKFTEAVKCFERAMNESALEAEACFYTALAQCRIQSVWDNNAGREIPLIHDMYMANLSDNAEFGKAIAFEADENKKEHYSKFADQVKDILKEYERIESSNLGGKYDYDCFVCVKQSDLTDSNRNTVDFEWLINSGLFETLEKTHRIKTFFADRVLKEDLPIEKGSNDYNAFIMYALQKAKVLLFVCSNGDYAQTPWVKNEYTRFISYHKNPQIVLVGSNPKISIRGITEKVQVLLNDDVNRIVECVKRKIEVEKGYVDPEYFYCEKCGARYSYNDGNCTKRYNGVKCDGQLRSAVEYANRRNEATQAELRDTQRALAQETAEREKLEAENEELRNSQPVTDEVAAAMVEQAGNKLAQAKRYAKENELFIQLLREEQGKNRALKANQFWLKWKFVYFVLAAISVAFSVWALVSTFHLPLSWAIVRNCSWLESLIIAVLIFGGSALCILGVVIIVCDGKSEELTDSKSAIAFWICLALWGAAFVCYWVFLILRWCGYTSTVFTIIYAVSWDVVIVTPIISSIIYCPRRIFAYATLLLCVLNVVALGIYVERDTNYELYINSPSNASQNLYYYYDLNDESFSVRSIGNCTDIDIVIPSSRYGWRVDRISNSAFSGNDNLTSITIPDSVTSIGMSAFEGCSSLINITVPDSVTYIGSDAFKGCSSLTSITLPNGIESIWSDTFSGCSSLTSIIIPDSVTRIGYGGAFKNCSSLTIYCEAKSQPTGWSSGWNSNCPVVWDYKNNDKDKDGYAYAAIDGIRYRLKDGLASVIEQPSNLSGVVKLPTSITYKHSSYSVTSIGEAAFKGSAIASITISNNVTSIENMAFYSCSDMKSVTISNSVKNIGKSAFYYCGSLTSITFNGTKQEWSDIEKGADWDTNTGNYTVHCTDGDIEKS